MMSNEELVSVYGQSLMWEHYAHARAAVRPRAGKFTTGVNVRGF